MYPVLILSVNVQEDTVCSSTAVPCQVFVLNPNCQCQALKDRHPPSTIQPIVTS